MEAEAAQLDNESSETLISQAEELARVKGCILRMAHLQREVVMLSLLSGEILHVDGGAHAGKWS